MAKILFEVGGGNYLKEAEKLLNKKVITREDTGALLAKHIRGDYGIIDEEIKERNNKILASNELDGEMIFSLHKIGKAKIGIYTLLKKDQKTNQTYVMTDYELDRILGMLSSTKE